MLMACVDGFFVATNCTLTREYHGRREYIDSIYASSIYADLIYIDPTYSCAGKVLDYRDYRDYRDYLQLFELSGTMARMVEEVARWKLK